MLVLYCKFQYPSRIEYDFFTMNNPFFSTHEKLSLEKYHRMVFNNLGIVQGVHTDIE